MKLKRKIEDGSCFVRALEVIFKYYNYNMNTYTIITLCNVLDVKYRKVDFGKKQEAKVTVNKYKEIQEIGKNVLPMKFARCHYDNYDEAIENFKGKINDSQPLLVGVNPYYLSYTEDYHKRYGGLFNFYHMIVIRGLNEEKKEVYVIDPTFNKELVVLSYDDFINAWSDGTGITGSYFKYLYYDFQLNDKEKFDEEAEMRKSIIRNIKLCFENEEVEIKEQKYITGFKGIEVLCDDLIKLSKYDQDDVFREKAVESIYNGIFHNLRWSRKSFTLFMKDYSAMFDSRYEVFNDDLDGLFNKWTELGMKLFMILKTKKFNRIGKIVERIREITKFEEELFTSLSKLESIPEK